MKYTAAMTVDVAAEVISNTPLSSSYNVLALSAPSIAAAAAPGQFMMVKTARGHDPLLRRPFSVFEILRGAGGTPIGVSLFNKRIGVSTGLIYDAQPGERVACLGPLGRPFTIVDPPDRAWMVAGGVGLAPFATLAGTCVIDEAGRDADALVEQRHADRHAAGVAQDFEHRERTTQERIVTARRLHHEELSGGGYRGD